MAGAALAVIAGALAVGGGRGPVATSGRDVLPASAPTVIASVPAYGPLMDSGLVLGPPPQPFGQSLPLASDLRARAPKPAEVAALPVEPAPSVQPAAPAISPTVMPVPAPAQRPALALNAPVPMPRPAELALPPAAERPRVADQPASRRSRVAATQPAAPQPDGRNFFQRLFGGDATAPTTPGSGMTLAYASSSATDLPQTPSIGTRLGLGFPGPAPVVAQGTAVYDISARTIYLPNGERLEAHSGLGEKMDDPRHAHVRMHGPTPPHVYDLTERERLFHGVRALRLNPVGGSQAIHGRAGLLAHTYLLGPRGDSNGCVSIKDYNRFLQAYLRGEVRRLIVVARSS